MVRYVRGQVQIFFSKDLGFYALTKRERRPWEPISLFLALTVPGLMHLMIDGHDADIYLTLDHMKMHSLRN